MNSDMIRQRSQGFQRASPDVMRDELGVFQVGACRALSLGVFDERVRGQNTFAL
jgi:hypothetical protein